MLQKFGKGWNILWTKEGQRVLDLCSDPEGGGGEFVFMPHW